MPGREQRTSVTAVTGGVCLGGGGGDGAARGGLCCAWLVVAASFVANAVMYGVSWSAGVFYGIFAQQFDTGSGLTALMTSLNTALMYGAGKPSHRSLHPAVMLFLDVVKPDVVNTYLINNNTTHTSSYC